MDRPSGSSMPPMITPRCRSTARCVENMPPVAGSPTSGKTPSPVVDNANGSSNHEQLPRRCQSHVRLACGLLSINQLSELSELTPEEPTSLAARRDGTNNSVAAPPKASAQSHGLG